MDVILEARQLSKRYGEGENQVTALRGVDLSIEKGTFTAIIGKSGSGKSTLLKLLSGIESATEGQVLFLDKDIHQMTDEQIAKIRRRKIGFVFQQFNLLPEFTVEENIMMPLFFNQTEPDKAFVYYIIGLLGLRDYTKKLPQQLSGGEQQRTAIARALVAKPAIVFADEPTGNLDSITGQEVLDLLLLSRRVLGQTLLLVTHNLDIAGQADRILTLQDGMLIQDRSVAR